MQTDLYALGMRSVGSHARCKLLPSISLSFRPRASTWLGRATSEKIRKTRPGPSKGRARDPSDDGDKRAKRYVSKSFRPSRKIVYPGLISKVNLSRELITAEDQTRGPCARTICPCPPASVAIVRRGYSRGERSAGPSGVDTFSSRDRATSLNPLHKHCIVSRRGCSHYIIFCY